MNQPEVVRPEQPKLAPCPRWERPADVDELTWKGLKNVTRWMLVQKYGLVDAQAGQVGQSS